MMKFAIALGAALSLLALGACGGSSAEEAASGTDPEETDMVVHLSPDCGCCMDWVDHMRDEGFSVAVEPSRRMPAVRSELGVSPRIASCHTGVIDGYLIEGHVPAAEVRRLLEQEPDARGLAVPGMPVGSPGMEMWGREDRYDVVLFDDEGRRRVFERYRGANPLGSATDRTGAGQ